jgi:hypothetical protein
MKREVDTIPDEDLEAAASFFDNILGKQTYPEYKFDKRDTVGQKDPKNGNVKKSYIIYT